MGLALPQLAPASSDRVSGTQIIDGSLKIASQSDTLGSYLSRTPGSAGNRKTWTWSAWVRREKYGSEDALFVSSDSNGNSDYTTLYFNSSDQLKTVSYQSSAIRYSYTTNAKFRDTGWLHIVLAVDLNQGTNSNKVKLYVNGSQITSFSSSTDPSTTFETRINSTNEHSMGRASIYDRWYSDFRLSQVNFIDGLQLGPEQFGFTDPLTNTWKPKKYTGVFNGPADTKSAAGTFTATGSQVGGPIANAYDGNIGEQDGSTTGVTFWGRSGGTATQSGLSIPVTSTVKIRYNVNVSGGTISVNGVSKDANVPGGGNTSLETLEWDAFSVGYSISSIAIYSPNLGVGVYVSGIIVDGVVLEDISAGVNGFYLPLDGNSPIGEDKSGNGNNYIPSRFGGSVALDNPIVSGARPILNTTQGGTQAALGVFGSKENKFYTVTTANGSVYQFDITSGDNPSLEFIRGATYRFDYTSHASHPLRFSSTNPDSSTTAYTQGTNTSVSNVITITVPHDAPDTLYYYCTAHASGMNGAITVTTDNTKADQYASSCVLAVPLVGGANDVSASIACTMSTKTATVSGAAADSFERNFYGESFIFDGSNDQLSYTAGSDFDFGGGDFTIETWLNMDTIGAGQAILEFSGQSSATSPDGQWYFSTSNGWHWFHSSSAYAVIPKARVPVDKWIHMALVREGDVITHYLDGVCEASSAYTRTDAGSSSRALIIGQQNSSSYFDGHLQDYRVYKGVAKYSGTTVGTQYFVPPSPRFPDVLPDTPSGVSGGSKLDKITTGGAVSFDGSGDYLLGGTSSDYSLGTGNFTIEGYIHPTNASGTQGIMGIGNAVAPACQIFYNVSDSQKVRFNVTDGTAIESTGIAPLNSWSHFAVVREGTGSNETKIYINGKQEAEGTISTNLTQTTLQIGRPNTSSGTEYFTGFISNFRVIKGTALYTSNFTPPTRELTNVTNTKLLCCQSNNHAPSAAVIPSVTTACTLNIPCVEDTFADQSASSVSITDNSISVGSAGSNSLGITTAAILPGGSGDAIDTRGTNFDRTGVYTIDCYFNYDGSQQGRLVTNYNPGNTGNQNGADGQGIAVATDGSINIYDYGDAVIAPAGSVVINQWHHLRFIANNTAVTGVYLNGVRMPSTATAIDNFAYNGPIQFGAGEGTVSHRFSGKLGPIRFTPGVNLGAPPLGGLVTTDSVIANNSVHTIFDAGDSGATNFNPFITDINTVRGQETVYCTMNPLSNAQGVTLSDGNLKCNWKTDGDGEAVAGTIAIPMGIPGKFYWELDVKAATGGGLDFGIVRSDETKWMDGSLSNRLFNQPEFAGLLGNTGAFRNKTGNVSDVSNYLSATANGSRQTFMVCVDALAGKMWIGKDGIWGINGGVGNPALGLNPGTSNLYTDTRFSYLPVMMGASDSGTSTTFWNFGQKPFKYAPPDGFQPLNDANVRPVKVISRPNQYVGIVTWMGNATSGREITGLNFNDKPDFIWIKNLGEAVDHTLYDSVRGFGANKELTPNGQFSEGQTGAGKPNSDTWGYVNSNTRNGFVVNNGSSGQSLVNNNNIDYVAWCLKAGGQSGNFNIDHVGYSTAGDAAMSIGDQNTTGYNTDQNWGSGASGEINPGGGALESGCFNGNFSDSINSYWGDASKAITYTFNDLPFKKIRFYAVAQNVSNSYVKFNGVAQNQARIGYEALKFGWFEAKDVPSPLNKIEVFTDGSSDFISLYAVEVDGKILVNSSGVTPPNLPSIPATGASVGTEQGFSIVTYTGTGSAGTIPHRLTQDPEFVIFKQRSSEDDWRVWHKDLDTGEPQDYYLMLQSTNGKSSDQNQSFMNRVPPTGPVIHLGTDSAINGSSTTMVCYSWHSVPGLQKFGKYGGNGSDNGVYVELGFRPAWLIIKRFTSNHSNGGWYIYDSSRDQHNPAFNFIVGESAYAQRRASNNTSFVSTYYVDFLSNGFKLYNNSTNENDSDIEYIYMAWAEAPTIDLYGGGANAR